MLLSTISVFAINNITNKASDAGKVSDSLDVLLFNLYDTHHRIKFSSISIGDMGREKRKRACSS
jgi:hypothetical protein